MEEEKKEQEAPKEDLQKTAAPQDVKGFLAQIEATLYEYMVKKAPFALPIGVKEFIVKFSPYLIIVMAVLALPAMLGAIGLTTVLAPVAMVAGGYSWGPLLIISLIVSFAVIIMEIIAVPGLFKRSRGAWNILFYASLVSLVGGLLSLQGLIGTIIGAIIGWYILFQIRDMYKN
jgi:hypothetical protein